MSTRHLVDPELASLLGLLPDYHGISAETLPALRAQIEDLATQQIESTDLTHIEMSEHIAVSDNGPPVRIVVYRPLPARDYSPMLLHVHGGGMVMGRPEMRHANLVSVARNQECVVASVHYRLAPEAPFPAAVEDCHAALKWLHANAASLGVDPSRITIAGESAGGGIAAGTALLARDRGGPNLVGQMLTYPMLDDRTTLAANPHAGEFVWGESSNWFSWHALLGDKFGKETVSPYAAPARAPDLAGLPPAFLAIGALDLFLEENLEFARRLVRAGVPTELHVYPGAFHAFDAAPDAAVTRDFKRDWFAALAKIFSKLPLQTSVER